MSHETPKTPRVAVIIHDTVLHRLLLMYRYNPKAMEIFPDAKSPEYYTTIGGGVEDGESVEEAARRELEEEANVEVQDLGQVFLENINFGDRKEFYFLVNQYKVKDGGIKVVGPETEFMGPKNDFKLQWIPVDKLPEIDLKPPVVKEKLLEHFKKN